jgi:tetratricopeptide (TPR) repeat protein
MKKNHPAFVATALSFLFVTTAVACESSDVVVQGTPAAEKSMIIDEYMNIGDTYVTLEKYDIAITYYERALKDKKLYWDVMYKLGRANALAGKWDDAECIYLKLLKRDPENASLKVSLAYITAMSGDIHDALVQYKHLTAEYPENQDILVNYVTILLSDGKAELAENQLVLLIEHFPDNKSISELKKKTEEMLGETEETEATDLPKETGGKNDAPPPDADKIVSDKMQKTKP